MSFHTSTGISSISVDLKPVPALLNSRSTRPNASDRGLEQLFDLGSLVMSQATASALASVSPRPRPPRRARLATAGEHGVPAVLRSAVATALPMPVPAPVTIAVFPMVMTSPP